MLIGEVCCIGGKTAEGPNVDACSGKLEGPIVGTKDNVTLDERALEGGDDGITDEDELL